jgi:crotonobetainyl-CoA:carnitine CoA-transferase CaiB-like acyl-CoA transferase
MSEDNLLLHGLRVIDCGTWVAAPAAATVLGDFGADVIKVESPPAGDTYRWCAQFIPGFPRATDNYPWLLTGRNKRSVVLDLKKEAGYAALLRLVAGADVFLTNFPPAVLEKLRLRYEDLQPHNGRLVYGQLSGYGEAGPHANLAAFDRTGWWARSGLMDRMRYRGQPPAGGIFGWGDHASAMSLFGAVMTGLYQRERSGRGTKVSTSLLANGIWANGIPLQARLSGAEVELETPRDEMDNALAIPYETRDGHWFYPWLFNEESDWQRFVIALGLGELVDDARFAATPERRANAAALIATIEARVRAEDWAHWQQVMFESGVDLISVSTLDDVIRDPQVGENGYLVPLAGAQAAATQTVNSPVFVHGQGKRGAGAAPALGQHSDEVMAEIGYSAGEIAAMRAAGVLG